METLFNTPILLAAFNRPELARKVFREIKEVRPSKLYFAVDGPRAGIPSDHGQCIKTRDIIKEVDWDCKLYTNFRDKNLGCKAAVSSAIDWFFKNEERGIILEDDTLPDQSFFRFCEELLERYEDDKRVMVISGDNFQFGRRFTEHSYYFSRYPHNWGWASWRRAWNHYDVQMKLWPKVRDSGLLRGIIENKKEVSYWGNIFEKAYKGEVDTWDFQWVFACWIQSGLSVLPAVNLVSNIGFGDSGTHTKTKSGAAGARGKVSISLYYILLM